MVAVLTNIFGVANLELAEDVVQDTLIQALNTWKIKGVPDKPEAWLFRVAKNKAIDQIRKNKHSQSFDFTDNERQLLNSEYTINSSLENYWKEELIEDQQLKMMYICCSPEISPESQIALILKTLCGFSTPEIAKAFLTSEDTISKRLYRAKNFFREHKTKFELPEKEKLQERTSKVLNAIYLLFNEGYNSSSSKNLIRTDLIHNALMLGKLITDNKITVNYEGRALVALMCFHTAREDSRLSPEGNIILLEQQNRALWNKELINLGVQYLNRASAGESISSYHIEAAIAFQHCKALSFEETNWQDILKLYDLLYQSNKSPIVAFNRLVPFHQIHGAESTLKELDKIKELDSYYLYHSFRAQLLKKMGDTKKAIGAYQIALKLTDSEAEQNMIIQSIVNYEKEKNA
ncbi:RNA polymerase subunit sigma-24 [Arcticibacterium luteifluviistationis]|uniref:RNA polymerase sigma factor n=2 Tax=Arcticibacterium luteifluviistationis TaxID=1784714 RepID=A0A2Z4GI76_9BACT|nr:RNA polymerase subunit sigma-24 [Arcticibacterium luteifluviistationis]